MVAKALMSSKKSDWQTPEHVLELVRQVAPIGLDPCTSPDNPCRAETLFSAGGLEASWKPLAGGLVYCNPPYGRQIRAWLRKCCAAGDDRDTTIIALVPARTDTRWWHESVYTANRICFWRGRLKFRGAPSSAPFPSALVYWGRRPEMFRSVFSPYGMIR